MILPSLTMIIINAHYMQQHTQFSIAFKPAESGWGGGGKYANNFDSIFNKKKKDDSTNAEEVAKKNDEEQPDQ